MIHFSAAVLTGLFLGLISIGYYLGARKDIEAPVINFFLLLSGTIVFAFKALSAGTLSLPVIAFGAGTGAVTLGIGIMIQRAIRLGFLSSMWTALNLNFIPMTLFCVFFYGEPMTFWQATGLITGTLCIFVLANQRKKEGDSVSGTALAKSWRHVLNYIVTLICLLLFNSVLGIIMKVLSYTPSGTDGTLWDRGSDLFLAFFYGTGTLATGIYASLRLPFRKRFVPALLPGLLAGTGSVTGIILLSWCVSHKVSGALFFPVSSLVTLLAGSIAPILFFDERINRFWIIGNLLAVASVVTFIF